MNSISHPAPPSHGLLLEKGTLHLLIALALLPAYFLLGQEFKLLVLPYVMFLVLAKKPAYFPAVLIHFLPGTMVSGFILVACIMVGVLNFSQLARLRLRVGFILTLTTFLMLLPVAIQSGRSVVEVSQYLSLGLGLFAFYYGALIGDQMDQKTLRRVLLILLLSVILQVIDPVNVTFRYYFLAVPAIIVVALGLLLPAKKRWRVSVTLIVAAAAVVTLSISGFLEITFVVVLSTFVAVNLIAARLLWKKVLRGVPVGKLLAVLAVVATFYLASPVGDRTTVDDSVRGIQKIEAVSDVLPAIKFKLFEDRGTLWIGAWTTISSRATLLPPARPPQIVFETFEGRYLEVEYGAHNIGLELLRSYGWLAGIACVLLYLSYLGYMGYGLLRIKASSLMLPVHASAMAVTFVGGTFGHFVLGNNFSLLLLALGGAGYGASRVQTLQLTKAAL